MEDLFALGASHEEVAGVTARAPAEASTPSTTSPLADGSVAAVEAATALEDRGNGAEARGTQLGPRLPSPANKQCLVLAGKKFEKRLEPGVYLGAPAVTF